MTTRPATADLDNLSRHYRKLADLFPEILGTITGALGLLDEGRISADEAIALIRDQHTKAEAANKAAWDELRGRGEPR